VGQKEDPQDPPGKAMSCLEGSCPGNGLMATSSSLPLLHSPLQRPSETFSLRQTVCAFVLFSSFFRFLFIQRGGRDGSRPQADLLNFLLQSSPIRPVFAGFGTKAFFFFHPPPLLSLLRRHMATLSQFPPPRPPFCGSYARCPQQVAKTSSFCPPP